MYNIGLIYGNSIKEPIFHSYDERTRELPYRNKIQSAVTFEMDSVKYEVIREEYTLLDWVAAIGGLGSILLGVAQTLH